jgi:hypothetical protein
MAPPDYCEIDCGLLALEIASKPGWTRFASQGFSEAEAGLECHASVGESSVRLFGPRLAPTHTGLHAGEQVKGIPESELE